ncbi:MAG: BON domain-containing protein [Candidatus Sulfotelmatobacter sp.]
MKIILQKYYRTALLSSLILLGGWLLAGAQDSQSNAPQPDNTKMNQGDQKPGAVTADQQGMNPADRETTKQIRKAIVKDKSISSYGHNVKVITQNGMVTLKGPVRSEEEKKAIEAKAAQVAGPDKVTDDLEVKEQQ